MAKKTRGVGPKVETCVDLEDLIAKMLDVHAPMEQAREVAAFGQTIADMALDPPEVEFVTVMMVG